MLEHPNIRTPEQKKKIVHALYKHDNIIHSEPSLNKPHTRRYHEGREGREEDEEDNDDDKALLLPVTPSHTDDELIKKSLFYYVVNLYV